MSAVREHPLAAISSPAWVHTVRRGYEDRCKWVSHRPWPRPTGRCTYSKAARRETRQRVARVSATREDAGGLGSR